MMKTAGTEPYIQKNPVLGKNLIFWILGIVIFLGSFCHLLHGGSLVISICLLLVGVALEAIWFMTLIGHDKKLCKFVEETSSFVHKYKSPLNLEEIVDTLKSEGFQVEEYPYGNYHGSRQLHTGPLFHVFILNHDTRERKETEDFFTLFVSKVVEAGLSGGNQFLIALEYGENIQEKDPDLMTVCKRGFMTAKGQGAFGFRIVYDTKTNILYFAEAVTKVTWMKKSMSARYMSELLRKMFVTEPSEMTET